jgi:predicted dehydrogenase
MAQQKDFTRRDVLKTAGAVTAAAAVIQSGPAIRTAKAAGDQVKFGMVGTGSRGQYLLKHLKDIDNGQCVALCDINQESLNDAAKLTTTGPKLYKDYRELLADKNVEAVFVTTPLFVHYPVTKDALQAGKHVFCEKCLVFKPEEVHGLRALAAEHPKQIIQTGLQRRYSYFYQTVKKMIDNKILGDVTHIYAQWHRNMINKPSRLWTMKPGGEGNIQNWRVFRSMSGGLVAELTSHQVDVSDWYFGSTPEFVMGLGGLDMIKDGRDVYDNVQLIYKYPKGQRLVYSTISTNSFLPMFNGQRSEMGEMIVGTEGTIQITVGDGPNNYEPKGSPAIAWWYREPPKAVTTGKKEEPKKVVAGATMVAGAGANGPYPILTSDIELTGKESFFDKEAKFARRWLLSKGVMSQEDPKNAVDVELESFFRNCRDGQRPLADLEVGLHDSIAVMLSNQAMDEGRKVYFSEIEKQGRPPAPGAKPVTATVKKG